MLKEYLGIEHLQLALTAMLGLGVLEIWGQRPISLEIWGQIMSPEKHWEINCELMKVSLGTYELGNTGKQAVLRTCDSGNTGKQTILRTFDPVQQTFLRTCDPDKY